MAKWLTGATVVVVDVSWPGLTAGDEAVTVKSANMKTADVEWDSCALVPVIVNV
jgi:hypothetical protein